MKDNEETNPNGLVHYRLDKLEEFQRQITSDVKDIKELLAKLDKRLAILPDGAFLNCNTHALLLKEMQDKIADHDAILNDLQKFRWRAVGIVSVVIFIVQLVGTSIVDKFAHKEPQPVKIELHYPTNHVATK